MDIEEIKQNEDNKEYILKAVKESRKKFRIRIREIKR